MRKHLPCTIGFNTFVVHTLVFQSNVGHFVNSTCLVVSHDDGSLDNKRYRYNSTGI